MTRTEFQALHRNLRLELKWGSGETFVYKGRYTKGFAIRMAGEPIAYTPLARSGLFGNFGGTKEARRYHLECSRGQDRMPLPR